MSTATITTFFRNLCPPSNKTVYPQPHTDAWIKARLARKLTICSFQPETAPRLPVERADDPARR